MKQILKSVILASAALAAPAWGQGMPAAGEDIVVVGSRAPGRLGSETASPVDILSADELTARGLNDLSRTLQFQAPEARSIRQAAR